MKIKWDNPVFTETEVLNLSTQDLSDFYVYADDADKLNMYFMLEASFYHYENKKRDIQAAKLAFLTAFYVFTVITPPASAELAMHFIKEAVRLNPLEEYKDWILIIKRGN